MQSFEEISKLLAAASICVVAAAYSHEVGYFAYVGWRYQALMTAADYLGNALYWFLPTVVLCYVSINMDFLKDTRELPFNWRDWKWLLFVLVLLISAGAALIFASHPMLFNIFGVLLFVIFWAWAWRRFAEKSLLISEHRFARMMLRLGPPVFVFLFLHGYQNAYVDINSIAEPYIVQTKDPNDKALRIILRSFERGLLVYNHQTRHVDFYPWENVAAVTKPISEPRYGLACKLIPSFCPESYPAP